MTPEQINKRIAEACGWAPCKYCANANGSKTWRTPDDTGCRENFPNYHGDLNAMCEAELGMDAKQAYNYYNRHLPEVCDAIQPNGLISWRKVISSTAAQRAQAFIRVIGQSEEA